jgi:hypothetical protein
MASLIISFISANFTESAHVAKRHHACFAISTGSKGVEVFPSGVVFVLAQIGVVGLA